MTWIRKARTLAFEQARAKGATCSGLKRKLGRGQVAVMAALKESPKTLKELQQRACDPSSVQRLEERGLVARRVGDGPYSPFVFFLTAQGRDQEPERAPEGDEL